MPTNNLPHSCNPTHCKEVICYSQGLWMRCICRSNEESYRLNISAKKMSSNHPKEKTNRRTSMVVPYHTIIRPIADTPSLPPTTWQVLQNLPSWLIACKVKNLGHCRTAITWQPPCLVRKRFHRYMNTFVHEGIFIVWPHPLVSMLPKIALLTVYYFIACFLKIPFTHKLAILLVVTNVVKWVV